MHNRRFHPDLRWMQVEWRVQGIKQRRTLNSARGICTGLNHPALDNRQASSLGWARFGRWSWAGMPFEIMENDALSL